jgi:hypothetical protein
MAGESNDRLHNPSSVFPAFSPRFSPAGDWVVAYLEKLHLVLPNRRYGTHKKIPWPLQGTVTSGNHISSQLTSHVHSVSCSVCLIKNFQENVLLYIYGETVSPIIVWLLMKTISRIYILWSVVKWIFYGFSLQNKNRKRNAVCVYSYVKLYTFCSMW